MRKKERIKKEKYHKVLLCGAPVHWSKYTTKFNVSLEFFLLFAVQNGHLVYNQFVAFNLLISMFVCVCEREREKETNEEKVRKTQMERKSNKM